MKQEINIISREDRDAFRGDDVELKEGRISIQKLRAELENVSKGISGSLTSIKKVGDFELTEVTFHVEISCSGKVSILGTGAGIKSSGAIELKFVRPGHSED